MTPDEIAAQIAGRIWDGVDELHAAIAAAHAALRAALPGLTVEGE